VLLTLLFLFLKELNSSIRAVGSRADAITLAVKSAHAMQEKRVAFEVQCDTVFSQANNTLDAVICRDHFNKVKGKSSLLRIFKVECSSGSLGNP
jgi:hypothetical protein